jgi:hypothetical protein
MVAADAQFGVVRILKPFPNFEDVYGGQPATTPIALPGGTDARAGEDGYSPALAKGFSVPLGSKLLAWIPFSKAGVAAVSYDYTFIWRMRNARDFRLNRKAYHFPRQSPGTPDSGFVPPAIRFVLPASVDTIIYEQPEPAGLDPGIARVKPQVYRIDPSDTFPRPLLPNGSLATIQQGVLDPNVIPGARTPGFKPIWMDALGDELIIEVRRSNPDPATWDFAGADLEFSDLYGTGNGTHPIFRDLGVYVMSGTNP